MSISIMIGSSPKDISRIQSTINILNNLKTSNTEIFDDEVEELSQWYKDILNILCNGGSLQDYSSQE